MITLKDIGYDIGHINTNTHDLAVAEKILEKVDFYGKSIYLFGPPGCGKTYLAHKRFRGQRKSLGKENLQEKSCQCPIPTRIEDFTPHDELWYNSSLMGNSIDRNQNKEVCDITRSQK